MDPDLHLDPDRLRGHAAGLVVALDRLLPLPDPDPDAVARLVSSPSGRAVLAELDRIVVAAVRAGRELADLAAVLGATADAAEAADVAAAAVVRRAGRSDRSGS